MSTRSTPPSYVDVTALQHAIAFAREEGFRAGRLQGWNEALETAAGMFGAAGAAAIRALKEKQP